MSTNVRIRAAGRDDVAVLVRLLAQLGYPATPDDVLSRLARLESTALDQVFLAERAGQVVGLLALHLTPALLHMDGPTARITALVVDERHAREGIGTALLEAAERLAHTAGCTLIEVSSNKSRTAAHAFYEAEGYERSHELLRKRL